jgi:hypothetical protein
MTLAPITASAAARVQDKTLHLSFVPLSAPVVQKSSSADI